MTSKLYIPIDTGLIIAEKYNEISKKQITLCKLNILINNGRSLVKGWDNCVCEKNVSFAVKLILIALNLICTL